MLTIRHSKTSTLPAFRKYRDTTGRVKERKYLLTYVTTSFTFAFESKKVTVLGSTVYNGLESSVAFGPNDDIGWPVSALGT